MILLAFSLLECDRSLSQLFHNFFCLLLINIQNKPHFLKGILADPSTTEKNILEFRYCTTLFNTTYNFNRAFCWDFLQHCASFTLAESQVPPKVDFLSLPLLNWRGEEKTQQVKIRAGRSFTYYCHRQNRFGEIDWILHQGNQSRIMGNNTKSLNNVAFEYSCKWKLTHMMATLNSSFQLTLKPLGDFSPLDPWTESF